MGKKLFQFVSADFSIPGCPWHGFTKNVLKFSNFKNLKFFFKIASTDSLRYHIFRLLRENISFCRFIQFPHFSIQNFIDFQYSQVISLTNV